MLLQSRSFEEILVQDIAAAATVNRATVCDHYTDRFALLDALVAGGFHQLLQERKVSYDGTCATAVGAIILAACDCMVLNHRRCPRQVQPGAFEPLIEAAITSAIRRVLLSGLPKGDTVTGPSAEMVATTASWAIYGAVKEWLQTPDRPPAEKITPVILPLILPILQAFRPATVPAL